MAMAQLSKPSSSRGGPLSEPRGLGARKKGPGLAKGATAYGIITLAGVLA